MEITQKDAINKVSASKKSVITYLPPHTNDEKTTMKRHIDDAFRKGHSIILVRISQTTALQDYCGSPVDNVDDGDPCRTRTCYLQFRKLTLYPDELRGHQVQLN